MKRLLTALAAAAALVGPAHALPPMQPHASPILVAVGRLPAPAFARAGELVRLTETRKGMFLIDPPRIAVAPVQACARRPNPRACLRPILLKGPRGEPSVPIQVAVLVQPARGGLVRMTCIGAGRKAADAARQSVLIDLDKALSGDAAVSDKPLDDASWCVFRAMNESLL